MLSVNDLNHLNALFGGYQAANQDTPGSPNYYGFVRNDNAYYIMKETISGNVSTFAYYKSETGTYADDWTNRASLTYARYDLVFK